MGEPLALVLAGVLALFGVAGFGIVVARRAWASTVVYAACLFITLVGLGVAVARLIGAPGLDESLWLPLGLPWIGAHFRLDALSAFFLAVVNLGGAAASLFALGYGRHEEAPQRVLPFFPAFLAAMSLVVVAADAFTFLISWESMSLVSWALVLAQHRQEANGRAGLVYILMASFGTLTLLFAFGLMAGPGGDYTFQAIRAGEHGASLSALVAALMLVGAGSKAGLVPLHVWLPLAHPAAPSHVSALMSGVMTKVAIYAFVRVVFDLVGDPGWWLSAAILVIGALTAVVGILHAVLERDLKRLLAYSTIENVGVIFIGLGLALAFREAGLGAAAALAFTAALFHVFNHALFKSLLFMGAGAVLTATGTRDMEKLGGLIHKMPRTALFFLAGALAISALPPLNGFVSEWLAFQAILLSPELPEWGLRFLVPAIGGLMALAAALVAATFVKAFGVAFLGRPRSEAAERATETDGFSLAALGVLAGLCLVVGILPGFVIDALQPLSLMLVEARMPPQLGETWLAIAPIAEARSSYDGFLVFIFITVSASVAALAIHRFASREVRRGPAWGCGFVEAGPDGPSPGAARHPLPGGERGRWPTQYSGASFAQPIRRALMALPFAAKEGVDMPAPGELRPARFTLTISDPVWDRLYMPLAGGVQLVADRLNKLQFLTIRQYLSLVFGALVVLLLALALWP
jgi:hydrogenase-4 component B